jgi:hypothetical protein
MSWMTYFSNWNRGQRFTDAHSALFLDKLFCEQEGFFSAYQAMPGVFFCSLNGLRWYILVVNFCLCIETLSDQELDYEKNYGT